MACNSTPGAPPLWADDAFFALFDDGLASDDQASRLLTGHVGSQVCRQADDLPAFFQAIERQGGAGRWVVLAADYEAGYWFEPRLHGLAAPEAPHLCAHFFDQALALSQAGVADFIARQLASLPERQRLAGLAEVRPDLSEAAFGQAIDQIRRYIAAGDCYQVNFTFGLDFQVYGHPLALYARLRQVQPVRYGGYFHLPGQTLLSLSPELFMARQGSRVVVHPMKGTAARGATAQADQAAAAALLASEKNRAENLMIVDLIRNDLGRLATPGAVRVDSLFRLETYPTLHQLVSTVSADLPGQGLAQLFRALFPCGSITGAPKIRAMEIIAELESARRGLYTGALGWVAPDGEFQLNVPIRTLVLDAAGQRGRLGIGAGIVQDSRAEEEWRECLAKARFATELEPGFGLIESLRLEPDQDQPFPLLELHLERLAASSAFFGFQFDQRRLHWQLLAHAADYGRRKKTLAKTRVLLRKSGQWEIESSPLPPASDGPVGLVWAEATVDSRDVLLRHKTSARAVYDQALARVGQMTGVFDALFVNERGEVTEGARSNIFALIDGQLLTPPLSAGLLGGVQRRWLLQEGRAVECRLRPQDLQRAEALFVSNAVRGLMPAWLAPGKA